MRLEFCVPLDPVAQPRVKAARRGKDHVTIYNPTKIASGSRKGQSNGVAEYKELIAIFAKLAYQGQPLLTGPIRCDVDFVFPRHLNRFWKTKPTPRYRHIIKPDRDNLDKAVLDALKGIVWVDDCQVCSGSLEKWHAAGNEPPHVLIVIQPISD